MKRLIAILIMMMNIVGMVYSQGIHRVYFDPEEAADVARDSVYTDSDEHVLHGAVSLGGGFMSGFGHTMGYGFSSVDLSYRLSDNFVLAGGFGRANGFGDMDMHLMRTERSFAPRRRRTGYMYMEGMYKVNERLTVAASMFYQQGSLLPMPSSIDTYALGVSAAMRYRLGDNKYLGLYLHFVRSNGMPLFYGYDDYVGWGSGMLPAIGTPFGYRQMTLGMADF